MLPHLIASFVFIKTRIFIRPSIDINTSIMISENVFIEIYYDFNITITNIYSITSTGRLEYIRSSVFTFFS